MKVYIVALFLSLTISTISAQKEEISDGPCPQAVLPPSDFSKTKFAGTWFEIRRYVNKIVTDDCGSPTYTLSENQYNVSYPTRNIKDDISIETQLVLKNLTVGSIPGRYSVYVNGTKQQIDFTVVNTDYTNYGIVWGCTYRASEKKNTQQLFIYSRTNTLSAANLKAINTTLTEKGISFTKLKDVEQDNKKCKRSIAQKEEIFDGACPAAVLPPSNFSDTKFAGKWFEIRRYVNKIVTDDCGSPTYTRSKNQYDVSYSIRNIAADAPYETKLVLTDQSVPGKYNVYVNGTNNKEQIDLLVLNNDYTNYGIVWGCTYRALDNKNTQQLFIYSRTNTLSDANLKEINKILTEKGIKFDKLKNVEQDNKKCKRDSGSGSGSGALVFPSFITGIIMLLIRSMF